MAKTTKKQPILQGRNYDPTKGYVWSPNDIFTLNGNEFGAIYQAFKNELHLPGGLSILQKLEIFNTVDNILKKHYEGGIGEEFVPQPQQN